MMLALIAALGTTVSTAPQADASKLTISAPAAIVEIDIGKLKGELVRLAWSQDASQTYVQTADRDSRGNVTLRHYVLGLDGAPPKGVDREPAWASAYWAWKSAQAAPGLASWKIQVAQQRKRVTSTSTPMGGDLARGAPSGGATTGLGSGMGISVEEAARAAEQSQTANVITLLLGSDIVGEFINAPALPGLTFGWGPAGSQLIAFANRNGKIVIMDDQGRKQEIPSSKAALLPGWTHDGKRLAFLELTGKKKFALRIAEIGSPTP